MTTSLLLVVAAALIDDQGRILLAQRPQGKSLAGLWEFPGGKVEQAETPEQALIRELAEELGITVQAADLHPLTFVSHPYPEKNLHMLMTVHLCRDWHGVIEPHEHAALAWVKPDELTQYPMPAADLPIIPVLQAALCDRLG